MHRHCHGLDRETEVTLERKDILAEVRQRVERYFAPLRDNLLPEAVREFREMKELGGPMEGVVVKGLRITEMMGGVAACKKIMGILAEMESQ